jgi:hypothetical protein
MIEGMKILFFRVIYGMFVMLILPVYNFIYAYAIANVDLAGFCAGSLPMIDNGVQAINESKYSTSNIYSNGPNGGR